MSSIRLLITDQSNGNVIAMDAPRRGEHVKNGVTTLLPPNKDACEAIKAILRDKSKLGLKGGVMANG